MTTTVNATTEQGKPTLVFGILAHVDAGKTTTAEAMLYDTGSLRSLGRVDHKDTFLDTNRLEKDRGITIFSKQAVFELPHFTVHLLDTPGHMDFSTEMERTLSVLDYAILVISGLDGVQAHTETVWKLLEHYHIPTFLWVNKMDSSPMTQAEMLNHLQKRLSKECVSFDDLTEETLEQIAASEETALEEYLETGNLKRDTIQRLIRRQMIFPVFFGSALRNEGVKEFLQGIDTYAAPKENPEKFGAQIYKITHDEQGNRLTWLKLTGGSLSVRELFPGTEEKVTQIRLYSGAKFEPKEKVYPGGIYAVMGLTKTRPGQGIGIAAKAEAPLLTPVMTYGLTLPDGVDPHTAMQKLSLLEEEDPLLHITWSTQLQEIQLELMGEVQIEVLTKWIGDRFGWDVTIDKGKILYRETIAEPVLAAGHFEPLRHYAEVHFLMEPLPEGSGLEFETACHTDNLDLNWQRLILTNLAEKEHVGVLTGSPITDMKITLIAGRAHEKHTEGGDFRQAVYRAVRQGLMKAENVLLEPYYDFRMEIPADCLGRAINDLKSMGGVFDSPEELPAETGNAANSTGFFALTGKAPASQLQTYRNTLISYTRGKGKLSCVYAGHLPCHNTKQVMEEIGYEAERDTDNPADSVFCSHGAGVLVKWNHSDDFMHLDPGIRIVKEPPTSVKNNQAGSANRQFDAPDEENSRGFARIQFAPGASGPKLRSGRLNFDDHELEAIMEREFGPIRRPKYSPAVTITAAKPPKAEDVRKDYLIVDGYNMMFAWKSLKELSQESFDSGRVRLMDMLANYRGYRGNEVVVVFDGYKVVGGLGSKEDYHGLNVVFTKEGQSADAYIEKLSEEIGGSYSVRVATSDGLIQVAALRSGLIRVSARELEKEVTDTLVEIADRIRQGKAPRNTIGDLFDAEKFAIWGNTE